MKNFITFVLGLILVNSPTLFAAPVDNNSMDKLIGNPRAAELKISACSGCHEIKDYRNAYPFVYRVPKLGGQNEAYIAEALYQYKNKQRRLETMHAIAVTLTEQDIADIAAYYSLQKK